MRGRVSSRPTMPSVRSWRPGRRRWAGRESTSRGAARIQLRFGPDLRPASGVALHELSHDLPRLAPFVLIAEDSGVRAPPPDLAHRGHDGAVVVRPPPARIQCTRDEVSAHELERGEEAADPDS